MRGNGKVLFAKEPIAVTTKFVSSADAFSGLTNQFDILDTFVGQTSMARQFPTAETSTCMPTTEKLSTYGTAEMMNVAKDFSTFGALTLVPDTVAPFDKFAGWTENLDDGQISQRDPVRQIFQQILNSSYHVQIFVFSSICTTELWLA